jgi:hypothetical protein
MPSRAAVLRRQAETCLHLSDCCSDPLTADHLRDIAAEFFQAASDIEHDRAGLLGPLVRSPVHNGAGVRPQGEAKL